VRRRWVVGPLRLSLWSWPWLPARQMWANMLLRRVVVLSRRPRGTTLMPSLLVQYGDPLALVIVLCASFLIMQSLTPGHPRISLRMATLQPIACSRSSTSIATRFQRYQTKKHILLVINTIKEFINSYSITCDPNLFFANIGV
jgi:hypothetical protein